MTIATSARIAAGVLALTIAARPIAAQQQPPAPVSVPTSVLERYVGEYVFPPGSLGLMRLRGDTLIREMNGQRDVYTPVSETRFRIGNTPLMAEFVIDQAGAVTQLLKAGPGPEMRVPRLVSTVPKSVLERYAGEYQFLPTVTFVVRVQGEALTGQQAGGPETVLAPISETRFKVSGTPMEVEFITDKSGNVTKVVRLGTAEIRALRKHKPS